MSDRRAADDSLTPADIVRMKQALRDQGIGEPYSIIASPEAMQAYRLLIDPHGIYAQRKALQRQFPRVQVYRGTEWWHG